MNRNSFLLLLAVLSVVSGFLMSRASLVGKVGIAIFYKEYSFLKVWWQGALAVFAVWMLLYWLQGWVERWAKKGTARAAHVAAIVVALIGLYLTYVDFRETFNHRLLGERFHLGAYLFWIGWLLISLYFLALRKKELPVSESI